MFIELTSLSPHVVSALKGVGYGRKDIRVERAESIEPSVAGGAGLRGFCIAVNLETGERKTFMGSWGGENMFVRGNPVDSMHDRVEIPVGGVIIKGTVGGAQPVWATLYANPLDVAVLPSGDEEELPEDHRKILGCFQCFKSGEYRQDRIRRYGGTAEVLDALVSGGYLKRNRAGATQITTAGKNAALRVN